jgi:hypothetical protein
MAIFARRRRRLTGAAIGSGLMFRNLPFCECASATIALTAQGFANLEFNRSKIFLKQT